MRYGKGDNKAEIKSSCNGDVIYNGNNTLRNNNETDKASWHLLSTAVTKDKIKAGSVFKTECRQHTLLQNKNKIAKSTERCGK